MKEQRIEVAWLDGYYLYFKIIKEDSYDQALDSFY